MKYYMPTKVYDEKDSVLNHAKELASHGKKALIITGRHSAKSCGALDDVSEALESQEKSFCVFSEVEENPSVETIRKASLFGLEQKADFVIGIGGGSPMDAAKAVAFLMKMKDPVHADLYDKNAEPVWLPVAAVPTTCGTGSEVTGVSVLTVHNKKTKMSLPQRIFPRLALIDGKYLKSAPKSVLVNTSTDALAHMLESCLSLKSDDYSRAAALQGLSIWKNCRAVLTGEKEPDDNDLSRLMRAAAFAGMAIAQTGTSIPHALSYILTYDQGIPHGPAAGYFLAGFLQEADQEDQRLLLQTAGFHDFEDFESFMHPVCAGIHVPEATLARAFETVLSNTERMNGCRFPLNEAGLKKICRL